MHMKPLEEQYHRANVKPNLYLFFPAESVYIFLDQDFQSGWKLISESKQK